MTGTPLLQCRQVTKAFGGLKALQDITFDLFAGEILCVIGPNGAGKSTLFNLLTGIFPPTSGSLDFQGGSLIGRPAHKIVSLGISRTFQNSRLFGDMSVLDNVLIGMHSRTRGNVLTAVFRHGLVRRRLAKAAEKAGTLLKAVSGELYEKRYQPASTLPQADRRRLEIARALASEPRLLLLDEPSAGMDDRETDALIEDIRKVQASRPDMSAIIIEHDMRLAAELPDRVIVFDHGRQIASGTFDEIRQIRNVQEAYLGK